LKATEHDKYEIDEKGTLKATEHDKYKNIARFDWTCSRTVMEMHITAYAA
jgi:uncharacterized hydantoinase/oxoprolinase family protein